MSKEKNVLLTVLNHTHRLFIKKCSISQTLGAF